MPDVSLMLHFVIWLAAIALVIVAVIEILKYIGVPIPHLVYVIAGAVVGIVILVWLSRLV